MAIEFSEWIWDGIDFYCYRTNQYGQIHARYKKGGDRVWNITKPQRVTTDAREFHQQHQSQLPPYPNDPSQSYALSSSYSTTSTSTYPTSSASSASLSAYPRYNPYTSAYPLTPSSSYYPSYPQANGFQVEGRQDPGDDLRRPGDKDNNGGQKNGDNVGGHIALRS